MFVDTWKPALDRFDGLSPDEQDGFRKALQSFVRMYALVAQIIDPAREERGVRREAVEPCPHASWP